MVVLGRPGLAVSVHKGCDSPTRQPAVLSGDRRLRSQTTEAPMAFGHCCRRAGASGEEPNSQLWDRTLMLEEVNGNSNFFFSLASYQGCRPE